MRLPKFLSHTSKETWIKNRQEFYLKYLADISPPKIAQTRPMSIGSAFDARVKSYLHERLYGATDPAYAFDAIFERQVEPQNWDWSRSESEYLFNLYRGAGRFASLMLELECALDDPKFEFRVEGEIKHEGDVNGVPMVGYPDLYFIVKDGTHCIYDFKVNGYCSSSATSPKPGYIFCCDTWDSSVAPPTRGGPGPHKNIFVGTHEGLAISRGSLDPDWAAQTSVYAWLEGVSIGNSIIGGIEQLVGKPGGPAGRPLIRVASFRNFVAGDFQVALYKELQGIWNLLQSTEYNADGSIKTLPHIFDSLPKAESDALCRQLDDYYKAFDPSDKNADFYTSLRENKPY